MDIKYDFVDVDVKAIDEIKAYVEKNLIKKFYKSGEGKKDVKIQLVYGEETYHCSLTRLDDQLISCFIIDSRTWMM